MFGLVDSVNCRVAFVSLSHAFTTLHFTVKTDAKCFLPCRYDIMFQCWDIDPTKRPSFSYHHQKFESFLSSPSTPATLVAMEIDEQKPYYHKANRHEPLHRLAASPSHSTTMVTVDTVNNSSNEYVDHVLPKIVEEREVSEFEASDESKSTSTVKGNSEETASTDDGSIDAAIESPV